tara:strand:- start:3955 stop:4338 length:384 start_codon:yes stop_codon:yes gene_type:complete
MSTLYVDEIRPRDPSNNNKIDLTGGGGQVYTGTWVTDTTMMLDSLTVNTATQQAGYELTVNGNIHATDIYCNDISVADLIMSNDRPNKAGNEIDGTKGSWVFQEGDENMYLINRKSGKKYKLTLEEV